MQYNVSLYRLCFAHSVGKMYSIKNHIIYCICVYFSIVMVFYTFYLHYYLCHRLSKQILYIYIKFSYVVCTFIYNVNIYFLFMVQHCTIYLHKKCQFQNIRNLQIQNLAQFITRNANSETPFYYYPSLGSFRNIWSFKTEHCGKGTTLQQRCMTLWVYHSIMMIIRCFKQRCSLLLNAQQVLALQTRWESYLCGYHYYTQFRTSQTYS